MQSALRATRRGIVPNLSRPDSRNVYRNSQRTRKGRYPVSRMAMPQPVLVTVYITSPDGNYSTNVYARSSHEAARKAVAFFLDPFWRGPKPAAGHRSANQPDARARCDGAGGGGHCAVFIVVTTVDSTPDTARTVRHQGLRLPDIICRWHNCVTKSGPLDEACGRAFLRRISVGSITATSPKTK
jgi:hypothetical protein